MLRRHVGENVKYQIDKNNNKNDHSDIDIKRLAIADHFFNFYSKNAPSFFQIQHFYSTIFSPGKQLFSGNKFGICSRSEQQVRQSRIKPAQHVHTMIEKGGIENEYKLVGLYTAYAGDYRSH